MATKQLKIMTKIIKHPHSYIGYQYFIERDGTIHQGRMDNEEGAHTRKFNELTIGICLMGNGQEKPFTNEQLNSLDALVEQKRSEYGIPKSEVWGHRDFSATLCPSDDLYRRLQTYKGRYKQ